MFRIINSCAKSLSCCSVSVWITCGKHITNREMGIKRSIWKKIFSSEKNWHLLIPDEPQMIFFRIHAFNAQGMWQFVQNLRSVRNSVVHNFNSASFSGDLADPLCPNILTGRQDNLKTYSKLFYLILVTVIGGQPKLENLLLAGAVELNALAQGALLPWIKHPTFQLRGEHFTTELSPHSTLNECHQNHANYQPGTTNRYKHPLRFLFSCLLPCLDLWSSDESFLSGEEPVCWLEWETIDGNMKSPSFDFSVPVWFLLQNQSNLALQIQLCTKDFAKKHCLKQRYE